ncbi:MAG TPA: Uma2 family endonuclease [Bryobacteraceae bacterium]|nr:Uma2 family endonuclease [Bryobacteraceae bacterium]
MLSPNEEIDRKLTLYFAEGAREVWVVDPKHRAMTVYAREGDQVLRHAVEREYRSAAAQAAFPLAEIFS